MGWNRKKKSRDRAANAEKSDVEGAALQLLSRRDHAVGELRRKLRDRGFPHEMIEETLEKYVEMDYLNDSRISERWVRELLGKRWGAMQVRAKLMGRGLDGDLISEELDQIEESEWLEPCLEQLEKKFGDPDELDREEQKKAYKHLMYRGYSSSVIRQVLYTDD